MPFVLRQITPVAVSRSRGTTAATADGCDDPRPAISNRTLSACLRQLASLVKTAGDMFGEFEGEAQRIHERTRSLQGRLARLQTAVDRCDSRTTAVRK